MGGSSGNYGSQIDTALQQANMPKSPLAQQLSSGLGANASNIFGGLTQTGPNAFPGLYSGASTPGSTFNGGGFQYQQPAPQGDTLTQSYQQGNVNPLDTFKSQFTGQQDTYTRPDGTTYRVPTGSGPSMNMMASQSGVAPQDWTNFGLQASPISTIANMPGQDIRSISPQNPTPTNQQGGIQLGDISNYPPTVIGGGQQQSPFQSLFPQIAQSNPSQMGLSMGGIPQNYINQLASQFGAPGVSGYNPSAQLLSQVQGSAGQNNIPGLGQSLQQALSNLGNVGGAQLPQNNFSPAQLQAANPQNVNPGNAGLQLGGPQNFNIGQAPLQTNGPQNVNLAAANLQTGLPNAQDSAYYDATSQLLGNQYNQGLKDLQSRFGAAGGTSRGTPAAFAQSQYAAQALPQLQAALGNVRQQEIGNQLTAQNQANTANLQARGQDLTNSQQNVSNQLQGQNQANTALLNQRGQDIGVGQQNIANQLQGQNQANNALLTGRGQDINNAQQNVQNLLQSVGLNNNSSLQQNQQNIDMAGLNQQGALANQGLVNQGGIDSLNSLAGLFGQQGSLNNSLLSNLGNIAGNAGQLGLGQNQLQSQNQLGTNAQNSQNLLGLLSQMQGFQGLNNQAALGQNQLNAQNSQFNAGQTNSTLQQYMQQLQSANQNQINNQFTGNQNLAQILAQFGLSGIPGGSANVNLSGNSQSGLQQAGSFLGGLGSLF